MLDIVVTGIGCVTPLGVGRETFWSNCRRARAGLGRIDAFDTATASSNVGGIVSAFAPADYMPPRVYRRMSRVSRMAVAASVEALADSTLDLERLDRERVAVVMGTTYGASSHVEAFFDSLLTDGPRGAQPFLFPETVPNAPASHIAMFHQITGPNSTFCQNQISAETAMLFAVNLLQQAVVDVALVGGAEELSAALFQGFDALGALNRTRVTGDEPIVPTPGDGLVLGEGAGVLVLERATHARRRGARPYGVLSAIVCGGGSAAMGHYEAEGRQLGYCLEAACRQARLTPREIGQISVSANFTSELDGMECAQLARFFERSPEALAVTPLKCLMGDFGGAGAVRAAAALLSTGRGEALPTVTAAALAGAAGGPLAWQPAAQGAATAPVLMSSASFGGGASCIIFRAA